ncbi:hypothetical protein KIH39_11655 [Telmatocola sphagniphila]|uniref:Uncharacterized protein n=1 Tax=Telmatocola sphagniphila TaxID=1123043 RepID=A0A8E6BAP5_9BACT|nr:hypothetical protein [Telmatocola sphagniphila]QVL34529.1 hypothetical protein KIH39_11655 [Telmatocola sphagniphila]
MTELTVHLRVNDSTTEQQTPVRFSIQDEQGKFYAPHGRAEDFPMGLAEAVGGAAAIGTKKWYYIDGSCEITLPTGVPLHLQVAKGLLYEPIDRTVTLGAGQMALRLTIEKKLPARNDFFVDSRAHFLTPHDALLEAQAEGLDAIQLLIAENMVPGQDGKLYPTTMNLAAFSGQEACLERDGTSVVVNTLNSHPAVGKVALLHCHRPIFPLSFGEENDNWSICDWCDQGHRKKGVAVWVDAYHEAVPGGEALVAALLGKIDAIELTANRAAKILSMVTMLRTLNYPVALVGSRERWSNKMAANTLLTVVSRDRTFVEAIREAKTYVTNGPIMEWSVEEEWLRARAESLRPMEKLTVSNATTKLAEFKAREVSGVYCIEAEFPVSQCPSPFVILSVDGPSGEDSRNQRGAYAVTSPITIGEYDPQDPALETARKTLRKLVEGYRDWQETGARFTKSNVRDRVMGYCADALTKLDGGS